tara:strand:+ start:396 stop:599 length:204 start_codon:yes stop_codon:yes gene_type:complete
MVEVVMISKGFAQFARATESALAKVVRIQIDTDYYSCIDEILQDCFECGCTPQEAVEEILDDLNFEH